MVGTTIPYQIVILTQQHSIRGEIFLHDERLSDYLNDRRQKNIVLRNASVARLESLGEVLEKTLVSILPKAGIMLVYEPPQKTGTFPPRFIKYPKDKYAVFLILDGMEVHGDIHTTGSMDLLRILADSGDSFLPITQATVTIDANPNLLLRSAAVVVNIQRIRLIGELEPKTQTEPIQQPPI